MIPVRILAPAKVNLGLAILGKRPDGYHDIDTIMAMIGLYDEIVITPMEEPGIRISGMDDVPVESNLMTKAARLWSDAAGIEAAWHIEIDKHIPSPAGIGGGSSDAAAVLRALNVGYDARLSETRLYEIAVAIGADCPFFLGSPTARATGTGTDLRPISPPEGWVVLAVPRVDTSAKTATLYGSLTPADYGASAEIDDIETMGVLTAPLPNSFLRPAIETFPELSVIRASLKEATGHAALSGAGPAVYAIAHTEAKAFGYAEQLQERVAQDVLVIAAPFLQARPEPELLP